MFAINAASAYSPSWDMTETAPLAAELAGAGNAKLRMSFGELLHFGINALPG